MCTDLVLQDGKFQTHVCVLPSRSVQTREIFMSGALLPGTPPFENSNSPMARNALIVRNHALQGLGNRLSGPTCISTCFASVSFYVLDQDTPK